MCQNCEGIWIFLCQIYIYWFLFGTYYIQIVKKIETICLSVPQHGTFMGRQDLEVIHCPYLNINALKTVFIFLLLKTKFFILLFFNDYFLFLPSWYLKLKQIYLGIITKYKPKETFLTYENTLITILWLWSHDMYFIYVIWITQVCNSYSSFLLLNMKFKKVSYRIAAKINTTYCHIAMGLDSIQYLEQTSHLAPLSRKWSQWISVV